MEELTLSAYAKINLTLSITGRRADSYHTLESVMQEISLADTLRLKKIPQGILLDCDRPGIPCDEKNLCHKAARAYFESSGVGGGVHITLKKCIPDGAGMGGGSSDAAAVLKGLSVLYPARVSLPELALKVGADVPFFLHGKTVLCEGIGEVMTPITFLGKERIFCVVAKDCDGLSTPAIYRAFDEGCAMNAPSSKDAVIRALSTGDHKAFFSLMKNDLEPPAIALCPDVARVKARILSLGAECAMMTGSGSAVFGLFADEKAARSAAETLKKECREAHFCTLL